MRKAMGKALRWVRKWATLIWQSRPGRFVLILVAAVTVGYVFLWWVPKWQVAHLVGSITADELFQRENEARQTWAGVFGGVLVLLGAYAGWRRVEAAQESVEVAREGQITERFTRAIEQLGEREKLEVRLGGIYALERIARDSERDHWPIMEVLTAYVRRNRAWSEERPESPPPVPIDMQAILTVLGRRRREFEKDPEQRLDLHGTDLRRADLRAARVERAHLEGAHLEGAHLEGAHLDGAHLMDTHLESAYLTAAHLEGAYLIDAHLQGASLVNADLQSAWLIDADLEGAFLGGADMTGARGLTREQTESAITDETTVLPDCLKEEGEEGKGGE